MRITLIAGTQNEDSLTYRVVLHLFERLESQYPEHSFKIIDCRKVSIPLNVEVFNRNGPIPDFFVDEFDTIWNSDGLILISPEYNGSHSPALKNLLNHFPKLSRKVFGIVTASDGALGGMRAAITLQNLVPAHFGILSPIMLIIPKVHLLFNESGSLLDDHLMPSINNFVNEFMWLTSKIHG